MQTFGIISLTLDSEKDYLTKIAQYAVDSGFEIFRFTPEAIQFEQEKVQGLKFNFDTSEWVEMTFPIPRFIYDRIFYRDEEDVQKYAPIINKLKVDEKYTFLGFGLPNKYAIYNVLKHNPSLRPYLPETKRIMHAEDVVQKLKNQSEVLIKPEFGSQGRGIFVLSKKESEFIVKTVKDEKLIQKTLSELKFEKWLNFLIANYQYILQPFLQLTDENLYPFDLRILLQKDEYGKWVERGRGLRFGVKGGIISNLAGGAQSKDFNQWFKQLPEKKKRYIQEELTELVATIPPLVETIFQPLFEIGMDIGIDKNGALWLLEVNSKPGRKVLLSLYPELTETLYSAPIQYAKFLSHPIKKGEGYR